MHPATTYVILTISGLLLQEQMFLPSVIRDWNELPVVVRQLDSVCCFKNYLNRDSTPFLQPIGNHKSYTHVNEQTVAHKKMICS